MEIKYFWVLARYSQKTLSLGMTLLNERLVNRNHIKCIRYHKTSPWHFSEDNKGIKKRTWCILYDREVMWSVVFALHMCYTLGKIILPHRDWVICGKSWFHRKGKKTIFVQAWNPPFKLQIFFQNITVSS